MMPVTVEIRRGSARFVDRAQGRITHHAFSFGEHYDAERVRFGPMVCHDDHLVGAGRGFDAHHHRDLVIVSWVIAGEVVGSHDPLTHGQVAVLRAGSGVEHEERASAAGPARFVQVWLTPVEPGGPTTYDVRTIQPQADRLVTAATVDGATFSVARLEGGSTLVLEAAPRLHVFVATGALVRSSLAEPLSAGDAFLTIGTGLEVTAGVPTELLVWELPQD